MNTYHACGLHKSTGPYPPIDIGIPCSIIIQYNAALFY